MFLDVLRHQFQVSKSKIYKRKRKRTLINVQKSSTTLNLPFSGVQGANSKSPSSKSTKKKEKNVNKRSYIIKKLYPPSLTFSRSPGRQFQVSKSEIYKKEGKRTLINILK